MQIAWERMKLPGKPQVTDLRTAIATYARSTLGVQERAKVSQFMCHDVSTADKFYVLNLNVEQAAERRKLFEAISQGPEVEPPVLGTPAEKQTGKRKQKGSQRRQPRKRQRREEEEEETTSEDESQVKFQESGLSEEEMTSCEEEGGQQAEQQAEKEEEQQEKGGKRPRRNVPRIILQKISPLKLTGASPSRLGLRNIAQQKSKSERIRKAVKRALQY
ncbi:uncharacterized protein [Hoplias malabaricus]|uniref:uncharacterized protein n=1 Tax=Hoplias malabaricus TaxID=27720 RepID=UPI003461C38C